jgi:hypothetical protein
MAMSLARKCAALSRLRKDLPLAAEHCYRIQDKLGRTVPLVFNRAQRYIHQKLEEQSAAIGKVRGLLLKGRQQGGSTYIGARFYHKTTMNFGQKAFIVAHESKATANLYAMVKRFHAHNPYAPTLGNTNAQELVFAELEGGYKLATAGTEDTGRSNTAQFMHGSEFALWRKAQEHLAGIGNTVADLPGTEIVLESTAKGQGNAFHLLWEAAEAGQSEWIPMFVPWYWQDEYRSTVRPGFELSPEDRDYQAAYGLDLEQMAWRANKIATYGPGFEWLFPQEYPATPSEAFVSSTNDPYIIPTLVTAAATSTYYDEAAGAPLVIGCDPAEFGDDSTAIVWRRGRIAFRTETYHGKSTMEVAGILVRIWIEWDPDAMFIDRTGIGAGVVDRLLELHYPVIGVHNGSGAFENKRYANRRAEMWANMREWLEDVPARIPDDQVLRGDLSAPSYSYDSSGRLVLESKENMKKRGLRSPDLGDGLALTFCEPVLPRDRQLVLRGTSTTPEPASRAGY